MTPEKFWMVWRDGGGPPTRRHPTMAQANTEACRLARINPGEKFFVLEARTVAVSRDVSLIDLEDGDDIPF